jgi:hypothetical protein
MHTLDGGEPGPGKGRSHDREIRVTRRSSKEGLVLNAFFLAFTLVLLQATTNLQVASRTVPLAVGIPLAALLAYRLFREVWVLMCTSRSRAPIACAQDRVERLDPVSRSAVGVVARDVPAAIVTADAAAGDAGQHEQAGTDETPVAMRGEVFAILWVLALPVAASVLGFVAGPSLFVGVWAKFRGGERTVVAAVAGAAAGSVILLLFGGLLRAPLPMGLLGVIR